MDDESFKEIDEEYDPVAHLTLENDRKKLFESNNDNYISESQSDYRAAYMEAIANYEAYDLDKLLESISSLYKIAQSVELSKQNDFLESNFTAMLSEVIMRSDNDLLSSSLLLGYHIIKSLPETTSEDDFTGFLVPFDRPELLDKLKNILSDFEKIDISMIRAIAYFISSLAMYYEAFRNDIIAIFPMDLILAGIVSDESEYESQINERKQLFIQIIYAFIYYPLDDGDLSNIIEFFKQGLLNHLLPETYKQIIEIINVIFDQNPELVIDSDIFDVIEESAQHIKADNCKPVLIFYNKYLDFITEKEGETVISRPPPEFLFDLIECDSKFVSDDSCLLIMRYVRASHDCFEYCIRKDILTKINKLLYKGTHPQKVTACCFLCSLAEEMQEETPFIYRIINTYYLDSDKTNSSLIYLLTSLISPDDPFMCKLLVDFFYFLFSTEKFDNEPIYCALNLFDQAGGLENIQEILDLSECQDSDFENDNENNEEEEEDKESNLLNESPQYAVDDPESHPRRQKISNWEALISKAEELIDIITNKHDTIIDQLDPNSKWKQVANELGKIDLPRGPYDHSSDFDSDNDYITSNPLQIGDSDDNEGYGESDKEDIDLRANPLDDQNDYEEDEHNEEEENEEKILKRREMEDEERKANLF